MYHVIVNPSSKSGRGQRLWNNLIHPELLSKNIAFEVHFSDLPGTIPGMVRQICETETVRPIHLIVLGGDGTFNEVLQGIDTTEDFIISYIPTGSSNDLARALGIPGEPKAALDRALFSGHPTLMDIGLLTLSDGTERRFGVSCGIGFDAAVCNSVNGNVTKEKLNRIGLGKLAYLGVAVKEIVHAPRHDATITIDGEVTEVKRMLFAACMNNKYEGGGFLFCPDAHHGDNMLDLCVAGDIALSKIFVAIPLALKGKHTGFKDIKIAKGETIQIHTEAPLCVHTDGEVIGEFTDITVSCIPNAVYVVC